LDKDSLKLWMIEHNVERLNYQMNLAGNYTIGMNWLSCMPFVLFNWINYNSSEFRINYEWDPIKWSECYMLWSFCLVSCTL